MNESTQAGRTEAPPARHRRVWVSAVLLVLAAAGALVLVKGGRTPKNETALALTDVVRLGGRLMLREDTNQIFSGWLTERYADGKLKSRSRIEDGLLHGVSEGWYTSGQLQVREHFVAGIAEGPRIRWHASGATQSLAGIAQGQLHGPFLRWREDGTLSEEVGMVNGRPEGLSRAYFPSGFVRTEATLKAGQVIDQQSWTDGERPAGTTSGPRLTDARKAGTPE